MLTVVLFIVPGLALLFLGAEGLVRGSAALALRVGLSPLLIGLTVVAFGTSSPELVVSVEATLAGNGDISLGNVIGSNICNIALILGAAALIRPLRIEAQIIRREIPLLIGASLLLWLFLLDRELARWQGLLLFASLIGYLFLSYRDARQEQNQAVADEFAAGIPRPAQRVWLSVVFVGAGLALLLVGAHLFVAGAVTLAHSLGISQAIIGLTIVALGTSLPELATSTVAAFKGEGDIAVGNVLGSNIFNILGILGIAALIYPLRGAGITTIDLSIMALAAVLILPIMWRGFCVQRWEGLLLVAGYAGYMYYLSS